MDNDTYESMNEVAPFLQTTHPVHEAYAVAGCMIRSRVAKGQVHYFNGVVPVLQLGLAPLLMRVCVFKHNFRPG
jgi:hypothetical protein